MSPLERLARLQRAEWKLAELLEMERKLGSGSRELFGVAVWERLQYALLRLEERHGRAGRPPGIGGMPQSACLKSDPVWLLAAIKQRKWTRDFHFAPRNAVFSEPIRYEILQPSRVALSS